MASEDGSVRRTGDDLTGEGDGESVLMDRASAGDVGGCHIAMVMARVHRHGDGWKRNAIGEPGQGRTCRTCFR
ncbi:hypothetical protein GWI34_07080 [Actinomadura sp. DSM 109109]|nr:hypothetical protein [Actinomadura lepetitiana]